MLLRNVSNPGDFICGDKCRKQFRWLFIYLIFSCILKKSWLIRVNFFRELIVSDHRSTLPSHDLVQFYPLFHRNEAIFSSQVCLT